jgi:hypothetical protein
MLYTMPSLILIRTFIVDTSNISGGTCDLKNSLLSFLLAIVLDKATSLIWSTLGISKGVHSTGALGLDPYYTQPRGSGGYRKQELIPLGCGCWNVNSSRGTVLLY